MEHVFGLIVFERLIQEAGSIFKEIIFHCDCHVQVMTYFHVK